MSEELKSCPFCGKKPKVDYYDFKRTAGVKIECLNAKCGAGVFVKKVCRTLEIAIEKAFKLWNTRTNNTTGANETNRK